MRWCKTVKLILASQKELDGQHFQTEISCIRWSKDFLNGVDFRVLFPKYFFFVAKKGQKTKKSLKKQTVTLKWRGWTFDDKRGLGKIPR